MDFFLFDILPFIRPLNPDAAFLGLPVFDSSRFLLDGIYLPPSAVPLGSLFLIAFERPWP